MKHLLLVLLLLPCAAAAQRTYWPVPLDTLALGHLRHTHVETTGKVAPNYPRTEPDSDRHVRLLSLAGTGRFITAECIPIFLAPCRGLKAGQIVTVRGITRMDPEHVWAEIHPIEWTKINGNQ